MKAFLALALLAALGLVPEANLEHLKPLDVVMPVNPEYAAKVDVRLDEEHQRITNGIPALPHQFPWQVALIIDGASYCGGSLISSEWVLTAAHCAGSSYQILLGSNRIDVPDNCSLVLQSTTSIVHGQYDPNTANNDIALIKLPTPVEFTCCIQPIRLRCIPGDLAGETVRVSGWGRTSDSSTGINPILMYADLTVITNTVCEDIYGSIITPTKICTSTTGGVSTCSGDSGGPLVYKESDGIYTQVGVVSFGSSCCQCGIPASFTRVTSYLSWIWTNIGLKFCCCS